MDTEENTPKAIVIDATTPPDEDTESSDQNTIISQDDQPPTTDNKTKNGLKNIASTLAILIIAPLIALSLTLFVFQSYEVDGPSMESTLQDKDRLIVYKLPRTIAKITGKNYTPKRGEIVIFTHHDGLMGASRQIVKRVMALPGERIVIRDGSVTVYNSENPEGFNPDSIAEYGEVITTTSGDIDLVVPEGSVYVCGDNRSQSLDSRAFGPVPMKDLVGKLSLRVYPFSESKKF